MQQENALKKKQQEINRLHDYIRQHERGVAEGKARIN